MQYLCSVKETEINKNPATSGAAFPLVWLEHENQTQNVLLFFSQLTESRSELNSPCSIFQHTAVPYYYYIIIVLGAMMGIGIVAFVGQRSYRYYKDNCRGEKTFQPGDATSIGMTEVHAQAAEKPMRFQCDQCVRRRGLPLSCRF
jgi:hypothetical protein